LGNDEGAKWHRWPGMAAAELPISFDEIQQVFSCDAADAGRRVVANQWERRRCSDGLVRAQVPSDVAYDFFMLQYRREPESRPAPVKEFEAAMDALCRAFVAEADADPALPATTTTEECGRGRRESVRTAA
jgi:hypothetical protein